MARKRMIDPNIWQSEDFSKLSILAKVVWIGLFSNADDEGRGRAKATYIKSILFPYDKKIKETDIENALIIISNVMAVTFYEISGNEYYVLDNWSKWQRVDRPQKSQIPPLSDNSTIVRRTFDDCSTINRRRIAPSIVKFSIDKISIDKENLLLGAQIAPSQSSAIISLTLNDKTEHGIYQENIDEWKALYPAVDILQQLKNMKGWTNANPTKRKTKSGINKFINGWLSKEQNKGGNQSGGQAPQIKQVNAHIMDRLSPEDFRKQTEGISNNFDLIDKILSGEEPI